MLRTNVLVIGGGPAGSTAARFLADSGIDTILLEKDPFYIKPCGGGIPDAAFHELKIPLNTVVKEIHKIAVVSPNGEMVKVDLKSGHLCLVQRGVFDRTLRELSAARGDLLLEAEFLRFDQSCDPRFDLAFKDTCKSIISVVRKKDTNEEIKIKSDYVIASDGITSRAASSLGIRKNSFVYTISTHILSVPQPLTDTCEFWFGSEHALNFYSWVFPYGDYSSVGTGSSDPKKLTDLLKKFIRRRFGITPPTPTLAREDAAENFLSQNLINKTRAFKIPLWNGTIFNVNNILFAGDTAGMVMPVTYEGIYYAMKSGEFAARAVIEGRPSVYKKLWNSRFRNRFLLMSKIRNYLFKSDENIEKFVALHKNPGVQEIAMRLWLKKETGNNSLISYLKFFKHLLK
jgi:geranylgeranyl reductase